MHARVHVPDPGVIFLLPCQEQKQENSCMQKEMATIEQVAQDNHERARRLMKELSQMQREYVDLRKQVRARTPRAGRADDARWACSLPAGLRFFFLNSSLNGSISLCEL